MNLKDRWLWSRCSSLDDMAALTARWLRRDGIRQTPGHCGPPLEETDSIAELLCRLNYAGFLTDNSQPGRSPGCRPEGAFVSGWLSQADYRALAGYVTASAGAVILTACGQSHSGHEDGDCPAFDPDYFYGRRCPKAAGALWDAVYVIVTAPDPDDPQPLLDALAFFAAGART